jgi:hypothetical protein
MRPYVAMSLWRFVKAINTEHEWQWIEHVHHSWPVAIWLWVDMHPVLGEVVHDV